MAQKRMFSLKIIDTDNFLEMPISARELYFQFGMRADDDGFVGNPRRIIKMIGASDDDVKILIAKKFIIPFESGVCVISDWKIHNYIQKDRYQETQYKDEKRLLVETENGNYLLKKSKWIQNGYKMDTQIRLDKIRLDKNRLGKEKEKKDIPKGIEQSSASFSETSHKPKDSEEQNTDPLEPTSYGREDINECIDYLKKTLQGTPDGTIKENRRFCKLLIDKFQKDYPDKVPANLIKTLIDLGIQDSFHGKNMTSFKYIFYNSQKIIYSIKNRKSAIQSL